VQPFSLCSNPVSLAESGQRREEGPPSGWIKVGLDSYVDPDTLSLRRSVLKLNMMISVL
jgi:hypothetical protein